MSTKACFGHISLTQTRNQAPFFFHGLLIFQGIFSKNFIFFINCINQFGTVQSVHRASLREALIFVILVPKSYMDRAHKPQISPRHGLDPERPKNNQNRETLISF